jgi:phage terminase large subunit
MIQATTSLKKIAALKKRIKVIRGGQGAGKTISILILLINHAAGKPEKEILIISEELTKMRLTVIKDFVKVMKLSGLFDPGRWIGGTLYRFPNGSFIKFIGLDREDVGKGLRSDIAYFNEVNKVNKEAYRQVSTRAKKIICDYNPDREFYIDTDVIPREDCDFLQLTFKDNEMLSSEEREEIESYFSKGYFDSGEVRDSYWANLWRVYGLGEIGNLEGVVFSNWEIIETLPEKARLEAFGLDFGYSVDPTSGIGYYQHDGKRIFDEFMYQTELTNQQIAERLKQSGFKKHNTGYADSAEPKSIAEINLRGFTIKPVKKGADSINYGIQILQQEPFYVTGRSLNLIKELRSYTWDVDRTGAKTGKPIDRDNHAIDAMRYIALMKLGKKKEFRLTA